MKVAILISMYDEHWTVFRNLLKVHKEYSDCFSFVAHSFNENSRSLIDIQRVSYGYVSFSDLTDKYERCIVPAYALSRNYSALFSMLYDCNLKPDIIVVLCGDTLIKKANIIERTYKAINGFDIGVLQAKQHEFIGADGTPGGRPQNDHFFDFMPQLFFVDGKFAMKTKVFSNISVTNKYTTEQCLGDNLSKYTSLDRLKRLNVHKNEWMTYNGFEWHNRQEREVEV